MKEKENIKKRHCKETFDASRKTQLDVLITNRINDNGIKNTNHKQLGWVKYWKRCNVSEHEKNATLHCRTFSKLHFCYNIISSFFQPLSPFLPNYFHSPIHFHFKIEWSFTKFKVKNNVDDLSSKKIVCS